jgi:PleD family two-component response regulator
MESPLTPKQDTFSDLENFEAPTTGQRILLVDDNQSVRDTLSAVLQQSGFEVVTAANVNDAHRLIGAGSGHGCFYRRING